MTARFIEDQKNLWHRDEYSQKNGDSDGLSQGPALTSQPCAKIGGSVFGAYAREKHCHPQCYALTH